MRRRAGTVLAATVFALLIAASSPGARAAGSWSATHVLQGRFAASSPPDAPLVAMNALGHAVYVWNATGAVRTAERLPSGSWTLSTGVPGGGSGAGPVAVAIGRGDLVAIAWTTVATRYEPSKLLVALRPAGGGFLPAIEVAPGTVAGAVELGIDCAGSVTVLWSGASGLAASTLAGSVPTPGQCNGVPGPGPWSPAVSLSASGAAAGLPQLVVNDAGYSLAVWQQGAPGSTSSIAAAYREPGGGWQPPAIVSAPTAGQTWNPLPGLDAAGNAVVGYLDGASMFMATRPVAGSWQGALAISGTQQVQSPALAVNDAGDVLAAWLAIDGAGGTAIWQRLWQGGSWGAVGRLSGRNDAPGLPSAAMAADGSVAAVTWTDDVAQTARASVLQGGVWTRHNLGAAYWGGTVPVAAGGGKVNAGWARTVGGNPNAAQLVGRGTP